MTDKKVNLKLTKKQAKVVLYWLGFAIPETRQNYEISKQKCKDDLKDEVLKTYVENQRKERDEWKYHSETTPNIYYKLYDLINED
jgi:hypothetical protein